MEYNKQDIKKMAEGIAQKLFTRPKEEDQSRDEEQIQDIIEGCLEDIFNKETNVSDFITQWLALWPNSEELKRHNVSRVNDPLKCATKMKSFIKDFYKHTGIRTGQEEKKNIILEVTKMYVNTFRTGRDEWQYINDSSNFISHMQRGSKLASCIRAMGSKKEVKVDHKNMIG